MVVALSWFQVEDVENPHSGPTTASTTNSTFNFVREIAQMISSVIKTDSHRLGKAEMDALIRHAGALYTHRLQTYTPEVQ